MKVRHRSGSIVSLVSVALAASQACSGGEPAPSGPVPCEDCPVDCGDGACADGESCGTCPGDCGACGDGGTCGDGACGAGEQCEGCPADCGACLDACGDGACGAGEACASCPDDCGACESGGCGDGVCAPEEDCEGCAGDCGACAAPAPPFPAPANADPGFVVALNVNIHKMDDDYRDLLRWIRFQPHAPDLILVQDFETAAEIEQFKKALSAIVGRTYASRRIGDFFQTGYDGWNGAAVLWRVGRFGTSPEAAEGWRGFDWKGSGCAEDNGSPAVGVRLADKISGKKIAAVSFKMSHAGGDECVPAEEKLATACNNRSFTRANNRLDGLGGATKIVAGDWNYKDACKADGAWQATCVYRRAIAALGGTCEGKPNARFVDPIYAALEQATPSATFEKIRSESWTSLGVGRARIDFMMARTGAQGSAGSPPEPVVASHAAAITYEAADAASQALAPKQNVAFACKGDGPDEGTEACDKLADYEGFYSDHRGQYARFHYP